MNIYTKVLSDCYTLLFFLLKILLVFPNEDFQSSAFSLAAHRGSYNTKQCATLDGALDYFSHNHPEVYTNQALHT